MRVERDDDLDGYRERAERTKPQVTTNELASLPVQELLPAIGERPRGRRRRGMLAAWERLLDQPSEDGDGANSDELCRRVFTASKDPALATRVFGDTLRAQAEAAQDKDDDAEGKPLQRRVIEIQARPVAKVKGEGERDGSA